MTPEEQQDLNNRLIDAAAHGDPQKVRTLLASGADVRRRNDLALRWAASNGHTETLQILLAAGANVHAEDDWALRRAADNGHTETAQALLASGADVHARDDRALRLAAFNSHMETVQALARHIFAADSWRGKSRAEIEAYATALYDKIEAEN